MPSAPLLVDRGIIRLSWLAVVSVLASIGALLLQRPMLVFVLALTGMWLAWSARKRAHKQPRWAGANRSLLAFIGGLVVVLISLPALILGLLGMWQFG